VRWYGLVIVIFGLLALLLVAQFLDGPAICHEAFCAFSLAGLFALVSI